MKIVYDNVDINKCSVVLINFSNYLVKLNCKVKNISYMYVHYYVRYRFIQIENDALVLFIKKL